MLKKVKVLDFLSVLILITALPFSLILKLINKLKRKKLWLICELKDTARDNSYHFFKYIRTKHPNDLCYYAINKKCNDYQKIKKYGNIIEFGSFKHWIYYLAADKNISTHKEGNPNHAIFTVIHRFLNLYNNRVFLQHGITKDNIPMFYYKNTKFKLFICGAKKEYEYIKEVYGYPNDNVVYTGFARFDNLHNNKIKKNQILIIPTWRRWFELDNNSDNFLKSDYYKYWSNLLQDKKLNDYAKKNNLEIVFYPHYQMKKYITDLKKLSKNIKILSDTKYDIQDLLKKSALMITDYSSVYMDFAYMKKPIIYYQFDYNEYRNSHLQEGYFDYKKDGFGKVFTKTDDLVKEIISLSKQNFQVSKKYYNRMNKFFEINDTNNCNRIYNAIKKTEE